MNPVPTPDDERAQTLALRAMEALRATRHQKGEPRLTPGQKARLLLALSDPLAWKALRELMALETDHWGDRHGVGNPWRHGAWGAIQALDDKWARDLVSSGRLGWDGFGSGAWVQEATNRLGFEWQEPETFSRAVMTCFLHAFWGTPDEDEEFADESEKRTALCLTYMQLTGRGATRDDLAQGVEEAVDLIGMAAYACSEGVLGAAERIKATAKTLGVPASRIKALLKMAKEAEQEIAAVLEEAGIASMAHAALAHDHVEGLRCLLDGSRGKFRELLTRNRVPRHRGEGKAMHTLLWFAIDAAAFDCAEELMRRKSALGLACFDDIPIVPCNFFIELSNRFVAREAVARRARALLAPLSLALAEDLHSAGWARAECCATVECFLAQALECAPEDHEALRAAIESAMVEQSLVLAKWEAGDTAAERASPPRRL